MNSKKQYVCRNGHYAPRNTQGECVVCVRERQAKRRTAKGVSLSPRQQAIANGDNIYFGGKPCPKHPDSPKYVNGGCVACKRQGNFDSWLEKDAARYDRISALCVRYVNDLNSLRGVAKSSGAEEWINVGGKKVLENVPARVYDYLCSLPEELRAKYEHRHLLTPAERQEIFDRRAAVVHEVVQKFKEKADMQEVLGCKVKLSWRDSLAMHSGGGEFCAENILLTPVSE